MIKKYHQFMSEITSDELYEGLLAYGLFSDKLPPIFSSVPFFSYCQNITHSYQNKAYNFIYYENMRNTNIPRPLAIPNPMAYQLLCSCLKDNWNEINNHFHRVTDGQKYKVSRIHIREMFNTKSLFHMSYQNWEIDGSPEIDLSFGKKYIVKADISSCFPSMYTHALPWALVSKNVAKANRSQNVWYNTIDMMARHTKHDETQGLLIGPHTSNLLSEIILTAVDAELSGWEYKRDIDDYTCYVETYELAQKFLTELSFSLRKYSLYLNHKKTEILELPIATTEHWTRRLKSFNLISKCGKTDYLTAQAYIDLAIELMYENKGNASILLFAMKVLASAEQTKNAEELCARTFINLVLLFPYLLSSIDEFVFSRYCFNCQDHLCIKNYSELSYKKGLEIKCFEQVTYACYFAIKYKFKLDCFSAQDAITSGDCLLMLLGFLYAQENSDKQSIKELKDHAELLSCDADSFDQFWLFIYEVLPMSKLNGEWKAMKKEHISFIKPATSW